MDFLRHRSVPHHKDVRESSSNISEGDQQFWDTRTLWRQAAPQSERGGGDKWRWKWYALITFLQLNSNGKLAVPLLYLGLILKRREQPHLHPIKSPSTTVLSPTYHMHNKRKGHEPSSLSTPILNHGETWKSHKVTEIIFIYIFSSRLFINCQTDSILVHPQI